MAFRTIRRFGDPVLRMAAEPITVFDQRLRTIVAGLLDTVDAPGHAGVAAPQIGVGVRAFSYRVDGEIGYVLNPEVVELSDEVQDDVEACLSPGLGFVTRRAQHAVVRGVDVDTSRSRCRAAPDGALPATRDRPPRRRGLHPAPRPGAPPRGLPPGPRAGLVLAMTIRRPERSRWPRTCAYAVAGAGVAPTTAQRPERARSSSVIRRRTMNRLRPVQIPARPQPNASDSQISGR